MNNTAKKHVVVGGGLCGLFTAMMLCERGLGSKVVLIEREDGLGGLLRSYDYGDYGWFDYGTHYLAETGTPEIDAIFYGLLPEDEWEYLDGNRRDLGGVAFRGKVQHHTPYLDLRSLPDDQVRRCIADFFLNLNENPDIPEGETAEEILLARFGEVITREVIDPVLRKLYGRTSSELSPIALRITPLDRVAFADLSVVDDLTRSERLRARIAYTDQRLLPAERSSGKKSFYPKEGGMQRVIDAIEMRLIDAGATIMAGAEIVSIEQDGDQVTSVTVDGASGRVTMGVQELYWTVGLVPLFKTLTGAFPNVPFDRPPITAIVNLLLERPLDLGDLFYCYFYDEPLHLFRVANYMNYCPAAVREQGVPVSVELLLNERVDPLVLAQLAVGELRSAGVLQTDNDVRFARAEVLSSGFPMPSTKNAVALDEVRSRLDAMALSNVTRLGILSEKGIFFQSDVMNQVYGAVGTAACILANAA